MPAQLKKVLYTAPRRNGRRHAGHRGCDNRAAFDEEDQTLYELLAAALTDLCS
jgi:hypothetical protein